MNEVANPTLIATEDLGRKEKIKLHDDEYEVAVSIWTGQQARDRKWEKGMDYEAVREKTAVALFFGD